MDYKINQKEQTITVTLDKDTQQTETVHISEILELMLWLKSRENDLRYMVHKAAYRNIWQPLHKVGNYMIGVSSERDAVKIHIDRYEAVLQEQEQLVRRGWLFQVNDRKEMNRPPVQIVKVDELGHEIENPNKLPELTLEDCPDYIVGEHLAKVRSVEWWVNKPDNLSLGQKVKLP